MGNNDLIQAICTMVNSINNQNALKRIYNLTFYLILHEEMGGRRMNSQAKETTKEIAIEQINEMLSTLSYDRIKVLYAIAHKMFINSQNMTLLTIWFICILIYQWKQVGIDVLNYYDDPDYFNQLENLKGM